MLQRVLLRALVTVCYAHWEGYVRFTANRFLDHVALRKLAYSELQQQFCFNHFLPRLAALSTARISLSDRCRLVDDILRSSARKFSRANKDLIKTGSNLNYDAFRDICIVCGINGDLLFDEKIFIDLILLKRRNAIAHGEDTYIDRQDLDQVTDKTSLIMRSFGNALLNHVQLQDYRKPAAFLDDTGSQVFEGA